MRPTQSQLVGRVKERADGFHMSWDDFLEETKGRILHLCTASFLFGAHYPPALKASLRFPGVTLEVG